MKLRLRKDLVIRAGTLFDDNVPTKTSRDASAFVMLTLGFGRNATGDLYVGHEVGDAEFDEWFERVKPGPRANHAPRSKAARRTSRRGAHGKNAPRDEGGRFA